MSAPNKRLIIILTAALLLLLTPLVVMQFTDEVQWTPFDFLVAGGMLSGMGILIEFAFRKVRTTQSRIAVIAILLTLFILTWIELAVGIFGTPFGGN